MMGLVSPNIAKRHVDTASKEAVAIPIFANLLFVTYFPPKSGSIVKAL